MFPVNAPSNQSLLRILVRGKDQKANCGIAQEVKRVLLNDILGFDPETEIDVEKDPVPSLGFQGAKDKGTLERERSFARHPCLNSQCNLTCSLCRVSELLQERFLPDLSPGLRSIVEMQPSNDTPALLAAFALKPCSSQVMLIWKNTW